MISAQSLMPIRVGAPFPLCPHLPQFLCLKDSHTISLTGKYEFQSMGFCRAEHRASEYSIGWGVWVLRGLWHWWSLGDLCSPRKSGGHKNFLCFQWLITSYSGKISPSTGRTDLHFAFLSVILPSLPSEMAQALESDQPVCVIIPALPPTASVTWVSHLVSLNLTFFIYRMG